MKAQHRPLAGTLIDLGRKLEAYRISRNIKQVDLAELAGISRSTLVRIEAGKGGTIDSLARVMRALDVEERLLDIVPDAQLSPLDERSDTSKPRQRVRHSSDATGSEDWQWDDETP